MKITITEMDIKKSGINLDELIKLKIDQELERFDNLFASRLEILEEALKDTLKYEIEKQFKNLIKNPEMKTMVHETLTDLLGLNKK